MRDITSLAREFASELCPKDNPHERDSYGKYQWESWLDEARKAIRIVHEWEGK